jgi:4-hydroxyphenylacetate 3-monooxygenase
MPLRSGSEYLASLRDERKVLSAGRPIDVTTHPGFRNGARAIAQFYDFQNLPEVRELMTYATPSGERAGMAFLEPRSREDLRRKAAASAAWADVSCGYMGRSPDYMNSYLATLSTVAPHLAAFDPALGDNARRLYARARAGDECFTHTFIAAFTQRAADGAARTTPRLVPGNDGVHITGVRGLATIAPFSNYNMSLEIEPYRSDDGQPLRCSFVQPMAKASGCTWVCRDTYDREPPTFDAPMSSRGDEMDAVAIFEDYFVPWEDVFAYGKGAALTERMGTNTIQPMLTAGKHHNLLRSISKTRFLVGLAHLVAESSGVNQFANIKEKLGEMVHMLYTLEAFALAAIEGAAEDPVTGFWQPHFNTIHVAGAWFAAYYPRMVDIIRDLCASRVFSSPDQRTMDVIGPLLEKHLQAAAGEPKQLVSLYRLAWDVIGSDWGSRHDLYEQFSVGGVHLRRMRDYAMYDKQQAITMVQRMLRHKPTETERFPIE